MTDPDTALLAAAMFVLGVGITMLVAEVRRKVPSKRLAEGIDDDVRAVFTTTAAGGSGAAALAPRNASGRLADIAEQSTLATSAAKVEALAEEAYPSSDVERSVAVIREVASGPFAGPALKAQAEHDIAILHAKAPRKPSPKKRAKKAGRK